MYAALLNVSMVANVLISSMILFVSVRNFIQREHAMKPSISLAVSITLYSVKTMQHASVLTIQLLAHQQSVRMGKIFFSVNALQVLLGATVVLMLTSVLQILALILIIVSMVLTITAVTVHLVGKEKTVVKTLMNAQRILVKIMGYVAIM